MVKYVWTELSYNLELRQTVGVENILFTLGGGSLLGFMADMAFRRIVKFAAIIIGLLILGLAFVRKVRSYNCRTLSYRGRSDTKFCVQCVSTGITYGQRYSKFVTHPSLAHAEATPIGALIGFTAGFALGVRH